MSLIFRFNQNNSFSATTNTNRTISLNALNNFKMLLEILPKNALRLVSSAILWSPSGQIGPKLHKMLSESQALCWSKILAFPTPILKLCAAGKKNDTLHYPYHDVTNSTRDMGSSGVNGLNTIKSLKLLYLLISLLFLFVCFFHIRCNKLHFIYTFQKYHAQPHAYLFSTCSKTQLQPYF